ncbi:MAG: hypothetical protein GC186_15595 [Rhodobacteraceae bacterium]|nr:hypothetical protein [Paracoccaceae bacterium]
MAHLPIKTSVTPLRQRMQQDMQMRGLGRHTQHDYIRHVRSFASFLDRAPDTATAEDIRRFQLHQHETGVSASTINGAVSALRFPSPGRDTRCAAPAAPGPSRHRPRRSRHRPPAPSAVRRRGSSRQSRAGSSCRWSSVKSPVQVGVSNQTLPEHRR